MLILESMGGYMTFKDYVQKHFDIETSLELDDQDEAETIEVKRDRYADKYFYPHSIDRYPLPEYFSSESRAALGNCAPNDGDTYIFQGCDYKNYMFWRFVKLDNIEILSSLDSKLWLPED
jgi:hypothetical protein